MISLTIINGSTDGSQVLAKGNSLNVRANPSTSAAILITVPAGVVAGTLLGSWTGTDESGFKWYCVKLTNPAGGQTTGSVREDVFTLKAVSSGGSSNTTNQTDQSYSDKVSDLVRKIAEIDQAIYKRLLVTYTQLQNAQQNGIDVSAQTKVFNGVVDRYVARQKKLQAYNTISVLHPEYKLYQWIADKFGLGFIQIPAAIAVGAIVLTTLAVAYALYEAFAPEVSGQADDLKITGEFKKFFDALPADKQALIKAELQSQLEDAYKKGASENSANLFTYIKWGGALFLGYLVLEQIQNRQAKRNLNQAS